MDEAICSQFLRFSGRIIVIIRSLYGFHMARVESVLLYFPPLTTCILIGSSIYRISTSMQQEVMQFAWALLSQANVYSEIEALKV